MRNNVETHSNASVRNNVEKHSNASVPIEYKNKFGPQINNLSAIMRGFKGAAKKNINKKYSTTNFQWQPKFHDHIIRNENELNKIRQYIINNPLKWQLDRNN
jgi:REP element-mobilizing transposase RayT